jgi:hypothetical protein
MTRLDLCSSAIAGMAGAGAIAFAAALLLALSGQPAAAQDQARSIVTSRAAPVLAPAAPRPFAPGCAVAIGDARNSATWFLPRSTLVAANHSLHRLALRIEARMGIEPTGAQLGSLEPGEMRTFRHAVPVGRSIVLAQRTDDGTTYMRQAIYIWNHGALSCERKFVWVLR